MIPKTPGRKNNAFALKSHTAGKSWELKKSMTSLKEEFSLQGMRNVSGKRDLRGSFSR